MWRGRRQWQVGERARPPGPYSETRPAPSRLGPASAALRLRGGAPLAGKQAGRRGLDREITAAAAGPTGVEMPIFRYVPYNETEARRSRGGGDHRNSKWRKDPRERAEEAEEAAAARADDTDMAQLLEIDEDKVAALLQRQQVSAKSLRRKRARKRAKDMASTLEEVARFDPRKRTAEEWIDAEMRGQSFHEMRQQVIESRRQQDLRDKEHPHAENRRPPATQDRARLGARATASASVGVGGGAARGRKEGSAGLGCYGASLVGGERQQDDR